MAINPSQIGSTPIAENAEVVIKILNERPDLSVELDPPLPPNMLVGYYNGAVDGVELYTVDSSGAKLLKIG